MNPLLGIFALIGAFVLGGGFFLFILLQVLPTKEPPVEHSVVLVPSAQEKPAVALEEAKEKPDAEIEELPAKIESKIAPSVTVTTTSTPKTPVPKKEESPSTSPTSPSFPLTQIPFLITKGMWAFSSNDTFQTPSTKTPPERNFMDPKLLTERPINPQTVVLVRCQFIPTHVSNVIGGSTKPAILSGTGVVVSSEGHILTAAHVLRIKELVSHDKERTWARKSCEIALTDSKLTPIDPEDTTATSPFISADIVFEPSEVDYNAFTYKDTYNGGTVETPGGGSGLDFALLQMRDANLPFVPLVEKLLFLKPGEKLIGLGYPGLAIQAPYALERMDGQFNAIVWGESSTCETKAVVERCGVSYQTKRYKLDYEKLYSKQTEIGKYTSYFRGGFSGGPLFYRGNVAGIMLLGREGEWSGMYDLGIVGQWNWVDSLSSHEIISKLTQAGITLPTVP